MNHLRTALQEIIDKSVDGEHARIIATEALNAYKIEPTRSDKGWHALFKDEEEWIAYLKWRKIERMYSEEESKLIFAAGRNYQQGEHDEYYGGGEHKYPDCKTYLQSLSPLKETEVVQDAIDNVFSKLKPTEGKLIGTFIFDHENETETYISSLPESSNPIASSFTNDPSDILLNEFNQVPSKEQTTVSSVEKMAEEEDLARMRLLEPESIHHVCEHYYKLGRQNSYKLRNES